jgi:ribose transport system ATP-binding protein
VLIHGAVVDPQTDRLPIAFIHQDLALVEWMTVEENIALAAGYPRRRPFPVEWGPIDWPAVRAQAGRALQLVGCPIAPQTPVASLSRTDKSIIAIARALATQADVIVLDEPTASLPQAEVSRLFVVLDRLRAAGRGMVYVSHRLDEIFRIADRVSVMRDGARIWTGVVGDTTPAELVQRIVGRQPVRLASRTPPAATAPLLSGAGIITEEAGPIDFALRPGEILGFAGLRGAGQEPIGSSKRQEESLAMPLAIRENLFINPAIGGRGLLSPITEAREAREALIRLREVGARPLLTEPAIATFSGGNQQKVVLSRWLGGGMSVLVLEEPAMGVDVGAKADIYALLDRHAAAGGGVIVVSTDFEEVAAICHRALIFDRGRIGGELAGEALTQAALIGACGGSLPARSVELLDV